MAVGDVEIMLLGDRAYAVEALTLFEPDDDDEREHFDVWASIPR